TRPTPAHRSGGRRQTGPAPATPAPRPASAPACGPRRVGPPTPHACEPRRRSGPAVAAAASAPAPPCRPRRRCRRAGAVPPASPPRTQSCTTALHPASGTRRKPSTHPRRTPRSPTPAAAGFRRSACTPVARKRPAARPAFAGRGPPPPARPDSRPRRLRRPDGPPPSTAPVPESTAAGPSARPPPPPRAAPEAPPTAAGRPRRRRRPHGKRRPAEQRRPRSAAPAHTPPAAARNGRGPPPDPAGPSRTATVRADGETILPRLQRGRARAAPAAAPPARPPVRAAAPPAAAAAGTRTRPTWPARAAPAAPWRARPAAANTPRPRAAAACSANDVRRRPTPRRRPSCAAKRARKPWADPLTPPDDRGEGPRRTAGARSAFARQRTHGQFGDAFVGGVTDTDKVRRGAVFGDDVGQHFPFGVGQPLFKQPVRRHPVQQALPRAARAPQQLLGRRVGFRPRPEEKQQPVVVLRPRLRRDEPQLGLLQHQFRLLPDFPQHRFPRVLVGEQLAARRGPVPGEGLLQAP